VQTSGSATVPTPTYSWNPAVGVKAQAYYAELHVPIFSPMSQVPLVRGFEFQASVRRDDFTMRARTDRTTLTVPSPDGPFPAVSLTDSNFQATKATAGLKYTVTEDLALRASFGTGFLPPTLSQLSPGASLSTNVTIIDPRRGNISQVISPLRLTGGNPDLEPEASESTSAGLVFTPRFAPSLRLSVDYTRIVKTNEIGALTPQNMLNQEALFPARIVRAVLTAQDQALGYTGGVITQLNVRSLNLAGKRLEAWDVQADYTWKPAGWGEFQAYAVATWQPHLESQSTVTAPWVEAAGYNNGAIEWRGNGGLTWTGDSWTLGWNTQYYGSYFVYSATTATAGRATAVLNQGSATVPSQMYHDVSAGYRWGASPGGWLRLLAHSQLTLGVQNVFDTSPPILVDLAPFGGNAFSNLGDPALRRYTISLRKKF
jgi:outer membrane receptor protein involved in Fe transport